MEDRYYQQGYEKSSFFQDKSVSEKIVDSIADLIKEYPENNIKGYCTRTASVFIATLCTLAITKTLVGCATSDYSNSHTPRVLQYKEYRISRQNDLNDYDYVESSVTSYNNFSVCDANLEYLCVAEINTDTEEVLSQDTKSKTTCDKSSDKPKNKKYQKKTKHWKRIKYSPMHNIGPRKLPPDTIKHSKLQRSYDSRRI